MTLEDKAKAYDEAIKIIRSNLDALNEITETGAEVVNIQSIKNCFYKAFPELKESDDERIRKGLIAYFKNNSVISSWAGLNVNKVLAWLEKQGERESDIRYKYLDELLAADDIYQMSMNEAMTNEAKIKAVSALSKMCISELLGLEKQGEPTEINPSEFDLRLNKLLRQFDSLPKEELVNSLSFYLNVAQNDGTYKPEKQGQNEQILANSAKTCKDAWSEEDDYNVQCCIAKAVADMQTGNVGRNNELIEWLKSLKERLSL